MNTKLKNAKVNPEFADLFSFSTKDEKQEHMAAMISFRILSEVEKVCAEKKIRKKDLAELVGTSRSYITQLFRGTKQVNTSMMAQFEDALDFTFSIRAKMNEDSEHDFLSKQLPPEFFLSRRFLLADSVLYCFRGGKGQDKTREVVSMMRAGKKKIQAV